MPTLLSDQFTATSGLSQGSHLGPTLLTLFIYINKTCIAILVISISVSVLDDLI